MNQDAQNRILGYFIEEARDHLTTIEQGLLSLRESMNDPELINELFRAAHSIKGGSAMLGLSSIQRTAHRMEDFFNIFRSREGRVPVDQHLETLLLRGFDTLSMLLEELQSPKGLTEEVGNAALAEIEPIFAETETHIHQLLGEAAPAANVPAMVPAKATVAPAAAVDPLQVAMSQTVPQLMREMLDLFKQREQPDVRSRLAQVGESLYAIGSEHQLTGWQQLTRAIGDAVKDPTTDLRSLALIALRDLKQGQQSILEGKASQVAPSSELLAMVKPVAPPDPMQVALTQDIPRLLREMLELFKQVGQTEVRSDLEQLSRSLQTLGLTYGLPEWSQVCDIVTEILADGSQDLKVLAMPILRELKQAHQALLSGHGSSIQPSAELLALRPQPPIEESFDDVAAALAWSEAEIAEEGEAVEASAIVGESDSFSDWATEGTELGEAVDILEGMPLEAMPLGFDGSTTLQDVFLEDLGTWQSQVMHGQEGEQPALGGDALDALATGSEFDSSATLQDIFLEDVGNWQSSISPASQDLLTPSDLDLWMEPSLASGEAEVLAEEVGLSLADGEAFADLFGEADDRLTELTDAGASQDIPAAGDPFLPADLASANRAEDELLGMSAAEVADDFVDAQATVPVPQDLTDLFTQSSEAEPAFDRWGSPSAEAGVPILPDDSGLAELWDAQDPFADLMEGEGDFLPGLENVEGIPDVVGESEGDLVDFLTTVEAEIAALTQEEVAVDPVGLGVEDFDLTPLELEADAESAFQKLFANAAELSEIEEPPVISLPDPFAYEGAYEGSMQAEPSPMAERMGVAKAEGDLVGLFADVVEAAEASSDIAAELADPFGSDLPAFDPPASLVDQDFGAWVADAQVEAVLAGELDLEEAQTIGSFPSSEDMGSLFDSAGLAELSDPLLELGDMAPDANAGEMADPESPLTFDLPEESEMLPVAEGDLGFDSEDLGQIDLSNLFDQPSQEALSDPLILGEEALLEESDSAEQPDQSFDDLFGLPEDGAAPVGALLEVESVAADLTSHEELEQTFDDLFGFAEEAAAPVAPVPSASVDPSQDRFAELLAAEDDFRDLAPPQESITAFDAFVDSAGFDPEEDLLETLFSDRGSSDTEATLEEAVADWDSLSLADPQAVAVEAAPSVEGFHLEAPALSPVETPPPAELSFESLFEISSLTEEDPAAPPEADLSLDGLFEDVAPFQEVDGIPAQLDPLEEPFYPSSSSNELDLSVDNLFGDAIAPLSELPEGSEAIPPSLVDDSVAPNEAFDSLGSLFAEASEVEAMALDAVAVPASMDADGDGQVDLDELSQFFETESVPPAPQASQEELPADLDALFADQSLPPASEESFETALESLFEEEATSAPSSQRETSFEDELSSLFMDDLLVPSAAPPGSADPGDFEADLDSLLNDLPEDPTTPNTTPLLEDLAALFDEGADASTPLPTAAATTNFEDELDSILGDMEAGIPPAAAPLAPAPRAAATIRTAPPETSKAAPARRAGGPITAPTMRVEVRHLDSINNLVGELVVNRNSMEQNQVRLRQFLDGLLSRVQQLADLGQRMQDQYDRTLLETALMASRGEPSRAGVVLAATSTKGGNYGSGQSFDSLEMDRFTGFHALSQEIIELIVRVRESSSDIEFAVDEAEQITRQFRQVTTQLQEGLNRARMVPFSQIADRLPRAIRDLSIKTGKQTSLIVEGRDTLIDKAILEELYDPMTHLVNNALVHGIEPPDERRRSGKSAEGKITIKAFYQGNQTIIVVADDGAGVNVPKVKAKAMKLGLLTESADDDEVFNILFNPGFSGRSEEEVDDLAGRGVGLDVVRRNINELRGSIQVDSIPNRGTTFTIRLPLTLSISKAMVCVSNKALVAFPLDGVEEMLDIPVDEIQPDEKGRPSIPWRDQRLHYQPLSDLLAYSRSHSRSRTEVYAISQDEGIVPVVILQSAGQYIALQVDSFVEEQEIVIKQLRGPAPKPPGIAGATVLGNGRVLPIADIIELVDMAQGRTRRFGSWTPADQTPEPEVERQTTVLIIDDSITVRELLSMTFNKVGYRVEQARDGQDAWEKLRGGLPCDVIFCDIEMPRMDGLELLSRVRDDANLRHLPMAMLTSRGAERHRQTARELGATAYFTKPYLEEELLSAAARMLQGEKLLVTA
ncbi:MAG: response regulator [Cyanobacteriota bacterium]|nr:response regulator [Cyanobacteriota bacterium]